MTSRADSRLDIAARQRTATMPLRSGRRSATLIAVADRLHLSRTKLPRLKKTRNHRRDVRKAGWIDRQFFNWHWDRNKFNDPSKATVEVSPNLSRYHRHGAESNKKYVSPDGHHEAVRNSKGELETHSSNIGTYNYYPYWDPRHVPADVIPYWIWGNAHDDPVDAWSRIVGPSGIQ